jgi:hypothetical protein
LSDVEAFFNRFTEAFATFEAANVAELFTTPGVALRKDGGVVALTTRDDVLRYYQAALDRYREGGCASCGWSRLETTAMGRDALLAAVTWHLLRDEGSVLATWRQSYCLAMGGSEPRIYASAMHADG